MEPNPAAVSIVVLRHQGEVLLRASEDTDRWSLPTGTAGDEPAELASAAIDDGMPFSSSCVNHVRQGASFDVEPSALFASESARGGNDTSPEDVDGPVRIYPFLSDCVEQPPGLRDRFRWVSPTDLLDSQYPTALWDAYDRVRPTVETIEADTGHGSTTLSVRALEVLRDEAALLARNESVYPSVEALVRDLVDARPTMTAVTNRVLRAAATTDNRTPAQVSAAAHEGISRALDADLAAARAAVEAFLGDRVATLSRSGTCLRALEAADPDAVLVAESRPGCEGVDVAHLLSESTDTTLTTDAAFPSQLEAWDADTLLVGADSILADGRVVNKVGTFAAALAGRYHDVDVIVVAASDKIDPGTTYDAEPRDPSLIADIDSVDVQNPTFEAVPQTCVDTVVTERGPLDCSAIAEIAQEHGAWRSLFDPADDEK